VDPPEQFSCSGKRSNVFDEFVIVAGSGGGGFGTGMAEQLGYELVSTHPNQAVDSVHRCPFSRFSQRPRPGQGVEVVGVDQRAVDVEEHAGAELVSHAGGSSSRLAAA
jgi:hypothetical protein